MEKLFNARDKVICIDSNGEFDDGSHWDLIEGKTYEVSNPNYKHQNLLPSIVAVTLFGARGVYDQTRFVKVEDNYQLEEEIFEAMKGVKIEN